MGPRPRHGLPGDQWVRILALPLTADQARSTSENQRRSPATGVPLLGTASESPSVPFCEVFF